MIFGHTIPQSLLSRSDSKNPATTCKGVTLSTGRSCRRALAATSQLSSSHDRDGVLAVLDAGDAAAFFCWQHKDQAESLVASLHSRSTIVTLKKKTSVDTLVERLGVLDLDEEQDQHYNTNNSAKHKHAPSTTRKRDTLPKQWQAIQGPLMVVPEEIVASEAYMVTSPARTKPYAPQRASTTRVRRSNVKASWGCCVVVDDDDDHLPARKRPTSETRNLSSLKTGQPPVVSRVEEGRQISQQTTPVRRKPVAATQSPSMQQTGQIVNSRDHIRSETSPYATPNRPKLQPRHASASPPNSQTMTFLSYIPSHLDPATTSSLLTELSRPISESDAEGFIYIFWLTPETVSSKPDDETASSLLDADESPVATPRSGALRWQNTVSHSQGKANQTSEALRRYASVKSSPQEARKILLKIGRTSNVHRRMSEWSKQCGQNITLIRYYPYTSPRDVSSNLHPHSVHGTKTVPHAHRVERLIHLELADKRVADKSECDTCGRVHREWFEVEATRRGVREVDEVIRRWVDWAQRHSLADPST